MKLIKTNKKQKQIIIVFSLFSLLSIQLVWFSSSALGWQNSHYSGSYYDSNLGVDHPSTHQVEGYVLGKKGYQYSPIVYQFGNNKPPGDTSAAHYSTHDWVADSALRRIAMSDLTDDESRSYKNKIKWLLDYDYQDHNSETPYKDFDSMGLAKDPPYNVRVYQPGTRAWWPKGCLDKLNWDADPDENERKWLIARRYAQFLHGTARPDIKRPFVNSGKSVPAEESERCESDWQTKGSKVHHVWWEYSSYWDVCYLQNYPSSAHGAYFAREAAADAEDYLNFDSGEYTVEDGSKHRVEGKFEMAAVCLGGMTHYITDLSSPPHTLGPNSGSQPWNWKSHDFWDDYADRTLKTRFTHTTVSTSWGNIFPNGGPNWEVVNPSQADSGSNAGFKNPALEPIDPYAAAMMMSLITFSACDISGGYMGELASGARVDKGNEVDGLEWSDPINSANTREERAKTLLKWAVYYSACAIMWVLDRCEIVNKDTTTGRLDILPSTNRAHVSKQTDIASRNALSEYSSTKAANGYSQHITDSFVGATVASFSPQLLFASFSILGTVSVLLGVPIASTVAEKIKEKEGETEAWVQDSS